VCGSSPPLTEKIADAPEWRFLLDACQPESSKANVVIDSWLRHRIRWDFLLELAENHGVLPLVHQALKPYGRALAAADLALLNSKHQTNLHRAMMLSRELIRIMDTLEENGIEVMPYKGLALADSVYGDIALRQTGDIDLLIRAKDVSRACAVLAKLNFVAHLDLPERQQKAYLQSGYEYMFDAPAGRNLLELQWAIQPRFYAVDFSAEELFERAIAVSVAGRMVRTPSFEDSFILLSLHAAKHLWAKLIWICDLARIMKMNHLGWSQIKDRVERFRIRRILTLNLLLANRLLGASIPSQASEMLEDGIEDLAAKIEGFVPGGAPFHMESVAYFRCMLRLREHPGDRVRFASRLLLTAGPGEWASLKLPDFLFPAYRLVRLSRVASKLAHL